MARSRKIKAGDARRARVILRLAKGESYQRIKLLEGCGSEFITRWRKRFEAERLAGLYARHRGRIVSDNVLSLEAQILSATQQPPADGADSLDDPQAGSAAGSFSQPSSASLGPGWNPTPSTAALYGK